MAYKSATTPTSQRHFKPLAVRLGGDSLSVKPYREQPRPPYTPYVFWDAFRRVTAPTVQQPILLISVPQLFAVLVDDPRNFGEVLVFVVGKEGTVFWVFLVLNVVTMKT